MVVYGYDGSQIIEWTIDSSTVFNPDALSWKVSAPKLLNNFSSQVPHALGVHTGTWAAGSEVDQCNTVMDPGLGMVSVAEANSADSWLAEAESFVSAFANSHSRKDWDAVTQANTATRLPGILGKKPGMNLSYLFHTTLSDQYIRVGDRMPGLLISPSRRDAEAMFFHSDGTVTIASLKCDAKSAWSVQGVGELTDAASTK